MNSEYITNASNYAQNASQAYEESLSYLFDDLSEIKTLDTEAANIRYQNLLNTIRQQLPDIQEEFNTGTKAAYVNKKTAKQELDADLARLGLNTQGFGVTQRTLNEVAYGQNYNQLLINKNREVRRLANQEVNALGKLNEDLSTLDLEYAKNRLDTKKYITESAKAEYDKYYNRAYDDLQYNDTLKQREIENARANEQIENNKKQQDWENEFKQKQYADSLAQQAFDNDLKLKQYNLSVLNSKKVTTSNSPTSPKTNNTIVTTNRCILLPSRNKNAQKEYDAMIEATMKSGISVSNLTLYLDTMQKDKIFTSADVAAIKKQFGI